MSLALVTFLAQATTTAPAQPKTSTMTLIEMASKHLAAINQLTDIEDLRHFNMAELQEIRLNAHFAGVLLELVKNQK